jgi:hypothetical protein
VRATQPTRLPRASRTAALPFLDIPKLADERDLSLANVFRLQISDGCSLDVVADGFLYQIANVAALHHGKIAQFFLYASRQFN